MNTNHTPGPWKVSPANGTLCAWRIETDTPNRPCVAFVAQTIGSNAEENANASLIAQAPALLAALEQCLNRLEHVTHQEDSFKSLELSGRDCRDAAIKTARAVIAQAVGSGGKGETK